MKFAELGRRKKWSSRSQASVLREWDLQLSLDKCLRGLRYRRQMLESAEKEKDSQTKAATAGSEVAASLLPRTIKTIQDHAGQVAAFEELRAEIQGKIDALVNASLLEAKQRADHQAALAKLAMERLEVDRTLDNAVRAARELLMKRSKITSEIYQLGHKIEFTWSFNGLETDRFERLEKSLPDDLLSKSEKWVSWLLGENRYTESYTVLDDTLILAETLANANTYRRGERVDLTAEQLAEVSSVQSSADYPERLLPEPVENPRVEKCVQARS